MDKIFNDNVIKTANRYFYSLYMEVNKTNSELNITNHKREATKKFLVDNWKDDETGKHLDLSNKLHEMSETLALKQTILYNKYYRAKNFLKLIDEMNEANFNDKHIKASANYLFEMLRYFEKNEEYESCNLILQTIKQLQQRSSFH